MDRRTPTYDDLKTGTWPWKFVADLKVYIPELDLTLEGRAEGFQEHEDFEDLINWEEFVSACRLEGIEEDEEIIENNIDDIQKILLNNDERENRARWKVIDRETW